MCGICGELRFDGAPVSEAGLVEMRDQLVHRGPDSCGVYVSGRRAVGLGFRRLKIIDLSPNASQPMPNEDGTVQVAFNGEIYNYQALRQDLIARGHRFRSQSDTEVIAHLYEEKGADCIADLEGMFAIAIWDERASRLTLARDRAGKKPLFYYQDDRLFAFASEIKAFFGHPDIVIAPDPGAVPYYFLYGYVPLPATIYKGVSQLEPGTVMTMEASGRRTARRYWQLRFPEAGAARPISRAAAAAGVRERLTRAVERRLMSDVPLGAFLSGGLDSTIVVGLMSQLLNAPVKTFSIGFEGDAAFDETAYARLAAERFKTDHTEFVVKTEMADVLPKLAWHYGEPYADASALPTYYVSRETRKFVTVALNGDGGDENFAGYVRYFAMKAARVADVLPGPAMAAALKLYPGALLSFPGATAYCATKAFVSAFSEGLWYENKARGVYVAALLPGVTKTNFHEAAGGAADKQPPEAISQTSAQVVEVALDALEGRSKPIILTSFTNKAMVFLNTRLLPRKTMVNIMGGQSPAQPPRQLKA